MAQGDSSHVVELYVRSLAAGDNQARIREALSQLRSLKEAAVIDAYEVHVWGDGVCLDAPIAETDAGAFVCERVAAFREWAHETGRELPGVADRTRHSAITGHSHEYIAVPTMALCERRDGDIAFVAPSRIEDEGTVTTVADRLAAIGADDDTRTGEEVTA